MSPGSSVVSRSEEVGDAGGAVDVGGLVGFGGVVRLCDGGCEPGFSGVACVESDARRWIVRRCPTCGWGVAPLCPSDISPCYVRIWAGVNPACPSFAPVHPHPSPLPRRGRGDDSGGGIPCVRFASASRSLVCLGFAKGTGDHEGRPYGLNWQTGFYEVVAPTV